MTDRKVTGVFRGSEPHWVGDGFYVSQVLPGPDDLARAADPFLMMDYNPPRQVEPTTRQHGVGPHPHRGFETVTLAFEGSVAHHDSTGAGGVIGPGDVQWMTAAGGILHKEYHEASWAAEGGVFHMMQLWVNLPAEHKMAPPRYQGLRSDEMGTVGLPGGGTATVIAGELDGVRGPAQTVSPIELWDVKIGTNEHARLPMPTGHTAMTFVLTGTLTTPEQRIDTHELGIFDRVGDDIVVAAGPDGARFIVLGGQPLDEPVVRYGPFVMNTEAQIVEAIDDFNSGRFGVLV